MDLQKILNREIDGLTILQTVKLFLIFVMTFFLVAASNFLLRLNRELTLGTKELINLQGSQLESASNLDWVVGDMQSKAWLGNIHGMILNIIALVLVAGLLQKESIKQNLIAICLFIAYFFHLLLFFQSCDL